MNAPLSGALDPKGEHSIGAILMAAGRLRADENERIVRLQRDKGLRFGEAAVKLGLASETDIRYAMARQFDYPCLQAGESKVSPRVIAAFNPFSAQVEALRALRSQLMLRWFDPSAGRKLLAVVSADRGAGRSWMAANLGVVFSQLGLRTLVIDADLRRPSLHTLFGLDTGSGLSTLLLGRPAPDALRPVPGLRSLAVLQAGVVPPNPQELLSRPMLGQLLQQYSAAFDVVILDTAAGERCADGVMVAARARAALMVARRNTSRMAAVRRYAERLRESGVGLAGSVMNGD
ncbi:chain length determinant protein tyrosine kinase EpsG [Aromatoleum evansii]|uniref:Chain length determinant protein tyrosine kinase EpsG n=1 Tax=Aromatoleum evansii TaxID=59406 RepID=A0ABZ1ANH7_AROEV|nr:chain length determinant protein tyrosine kinase EpsG [Aromatoleum evansii]NMG31219.1 chain length determinant protein tyrosine kinase EpsG [Aromatoleum evansii]WRL47333.1 chain length determinant protein tyrosine kinase EpsG [Aromatoleum evansii]